MSNFIRNELKRIVLRNPPWITKPLQCMINRENRLFKIFKIHCYKPEDKARFDNFPKDFKRHCYKPEDKVRLDNFPKIFKRHCYKPEDKVRLDNFRKDFKIHCYKPEDKVRLDNFPKDFKRHCCKPEDKVRRDNFRKECQEAVENAKLSYFTNLGKSYTILILATYFNGK